MADKRYRVNVDINGPATPGFKINGTKVIGAQASTFAALTDNSTGAAADTIAAGAGIHTIPFYVNLATLANGDVVTDYVPGYKFKILSVDFRVHIPVTTGSKAATLNMEIVSTDVTGGVIALTSANCTPTGAAVAGSSVTAANTGTAAQAFSIEASSVTAFAEGSGWILVRIQNMDTADAIASLASKINTIRTGVRAHGLFA